MQDTQELRRAYTRLRMVRSSLLLLAGLVLLWRPGVASAECTASETDIRDALLGRIPVSLLSMDCNGDGKVDAADVVAKTRATAGDIVTVAFSTADSKLTEGRAAASIELVFSKPYTGNVSYAVSGGSAIVGEDYAAFTGNLAVSGAIRADIPVSLIDDVRIKRDTQGGPESRTLLVELVDLQGNNTYDLGKITSHLLIIQDDDSLWRGAMTDGTSTRPFSLEITRQAGVTRGTLTSDGAEAIPAGEWPASVSWAGEQLSIAVGPIDIPASNSGMNLPFVRAYTFRANQTGDYYEVDSVSLTVTEKTEFPSAEHLNRDISGIADLRRSIPNVNPPDSDLLTASEVLASKNAQKR